MNVILDENIIEFAAKMEDPNGVRDPTCGSLLHDIVKRCDVIHCSTELCCKYMKKLSSLEKSKHMASYIMMLLIHASPQGKIRYHEAHELS